MAGVAILIVNVPDVARVLSHAYAGPYGHTSKTPDATRAQGDYITGLLGKGIGRVHGFVEVKGAPSTPLRARVRLVRERDGRVYREQWSDAVTGAFIFDWVDELEVYELRTSHPQHAFRGVCADGIKPDLMPGVSS